MIMKADPYLAERLSRPGTLPQEMAYILWHTPLPVLSKTSAFSLGAADGDSPRRLISNESAAFCIPRTPAPGSPGINCTCVVSREPRKQLFV